MWEHINMHVYSSKEQCPVLCPQYQMAVVSRCRAMMLDSGQGLFTSEYFIAPQVILLHHRSELPQSSQCHHNGF